MKKRILSTILSLALVFNMAGTVALAEDAVPAPNPPESSSSEAVMVTPLGASNVQCTCKVKCTAADAGTGAEEAIDKTCSVCGTANADLSLCVASSGIALVPGISSLEDGKTYTISDKNQLNHLATLVNSGQTGKGSTITLLKDITNETNETNVSIGTATKRFEGTFDGGGHVVHLFIFKPTIDYLGLFGNLGVDGVVKNVGVAGTVAGASKVGGVVGYSQGIVQNCYNASKVTGTEYNVGGVVGYNNGSVLNCYNTESVSCGSLNRGGMVGGVVGTNYVDKTVENCFNIATVTSTNGGGNTIGGVVGENLGQVKNCYNTGAVSGGKDAGGVVGVNSDKVENCYNTGNIKGFETLGGVVGRFQTIPNPNPNPSVVQNCVSLGMEVQTHTKNVAMGRVVGNNVGNTFANNKSRSDMQVDNKTVDNGTLDNNNGLNVELNAMQKDVFSGWDTDIWDISQTDKLNVGNLPTLNGIETSQTPSLPGGKTDISRNLKASISDWTYGQMANTPSLTGYTANGTPVITYTYSGRNGTTYPSNATVPTSAGDYRVTANYMDDMQQGTSQADFAITPKTLTDVTATIAGTYTYTGLPQEPTVTVESGTATLVKDTDYTLAFSNNKDVGTAAATATFIGNYRGTANSTFTINPAPLTIAGGTVTARNYIEGDTSATIAELTFDGVVNSETLTLDTDYTVGTPVFADANAGTGKTVTGTAALTTTATAKNYTLTGRYTLQNGVINKIEYPGATTIPTTVRSGKNSTGNTVTLPTPPTGAHYSVATTEGTLIKGLPTVSGTTLTFDATNQPEGTTATISILVNDATNYKPYFVSIAVTAVNKDTVTITGLAAATGLTYSGKNQQGYSGTVKVEGDKVPVGQLIYTYTGTGSTNYNSTVSPTNAGTYKLVVSVADSNASYIGAHADINFTIGQKSLTITTQSYKSYQYKELPNLMYPLVYTGFVPGEGMDGLTNTLKAAYMANYDTGVNSNTPGDKAIKVIVQGTETNTNYAITLADGKLTVYPAGKEDHAPPTLPTAPIGGTPVVVGEPIDPAKTLRVVTAELIPEEEQQAATQLLAQGVSPTALMDSHEVELQVSTDGGVTWTKATAADVKNGTVKVALPIPTGTSSATHSYKIYHFANGANAAPITLQPTEDTASASLTASITSFSPFVVVATAKSAPPPSNGGGDSSSDSDEYDFWMNAKDKIKAADNGDVIKVNAKGYDKMPTSVMEALRKNSGVTLVISWNVGNTITIPAGKAKKPEAGRIYYPLTLLAELYNGVQLVEVPSAKNQINPETGGDAVVLNAPEVQQSPITPPTVSERAITTPDKGFEMDAFAGTPDAAAASGNAGVWFAVVMAMLAALAGGVWFWKNKLTKQR